MGNLTPFGLSPFDILIKDFFNQDTEFRPAHQTKINHPVDIYEANDGLNIDIACVGLTKKDIEITVEGDILKETTFNKVLGKIKKNKNKISVISNLPYKTAVPILAKILKNRSFFHKLCNYFFT